MKKSMLLAAVFVASMFVAACANAPVLSPAQLAAAFCPATQNAITLVAAFNGTLSPTVPAVANANDVIEKIVKPAVNGVCAAGATITSTKVQTLISQGIPAIAGVVAGLPIPSPTQAAIQAGFAAAELATNLINQYENALAAAKAAAAAAASGASAVAAPAPVASGAST
ncbi:hypothetical protein Q8F57_003100 [Paraburkholderia terrae]|uniref:hypothetical protein n=1 Tax=Paraburkholderia terrae TaxID=311230 RepID=UPI00296B1480|nr:hypothetical protein [Paraburkholderia terrae]MDW3655488.1 hypothetical protein [Paraburkholderia terrae]